MPIYNGQGQAKVRFRTPIVGSQSQISTLWNSIYGVWNGDSPGSTSLKTSLYASYNGESNANDSFGTNNGTAVGGLTYTSGKIGNAFSFNGTNAYVSLPNSSGQFNFDGDFSVSMWFKSSNLSTSRYAIGNFKAGGTYGYGWSLYYSLAGGFAFDLRNGNNINQVRKIQTISTNTWYHVVAVRKMGQIHKLYVNGIDTLAPQTDGNVNNIAGYTANQPMNLGGLSDINLPALCDLDGVNIWQKELTQSEITELYNSGNGAQYIGDNFYKPTTNDALLVNNGTAVGGLTYDIGKVGTAFMFNGTNAHVLMPVNSMKKTTFSMNFWIFNRSAQNATIFSDFGNDGTNKGFYLDLSSLSSHTIRFVGFNSSTNTIALSATGNPGFLNRWSMATITVSGTSVKIYLDGTLSASGTMSNTLNYVANSYPCIGAFKSNNNTPNSYLSNGTKIDAFGIWNKELTQSEITELYNSGAGKQYVSYVSSLDVDAQAFLSAASITNTTQQNAINTLVTSLKTAGIWTKMKAIYPFVGGSATSHKFNLKDPRDLDAAFRLVFSGGWTHTSTGALPNGSNAYANTFLATRGQGMANDSMHMSFYSRTDASSGCDMGGGQTPNYYNYFYAKNGSSISVAVNDGGFAISSTASSAAFYLATRNSSTQVAVFRNSVKLSLSNSTRTSVTDIPIILGALNNNGIGTPSPTSYSTRQQAFASIGDGLTDAEATAFYNAVQAYQTTLGRQV